MTSEPVMSRRAPSGRAWQVGEVYTLHFWPPYGDPEVQQAKHYTGWTEKGQLARRLTEHALGRGARLTQVQREAGGTWVVADVQPGTRDREQQLKERGAARRCEVCRAIADYEAGQLTQPEALARARWASATPPERRVLLDIFGIEQAPEHIPEPLPEVRPFSPVPDPQVIEATPELEALVAELEKGWHKEARAEPEPEIEQLPAIPAPRPAPEPQAQVETAPEADALLQGPPREVEAEPEPEPELELEI
jgi:predicted GIY-YIG superfamily endonuclease